jgi:glycosyltransferase involved in cell wall biosynthesis
MVPGITRKARIAIVHPWFLAHGGAEHVVDVLASMFPQADFFTLFYTPKDLPANLQKRKITASKANWLPWKYVIYRYLLPFYPIAFEEIDLRGYDLVITSDSCVAKGVLVDQHARHICYCHSPMRAVWDKRFEFRQFIPYLGRPIYTLVTHHIRQWDFQAAQRVDVFVANSKYVRERIKKYYRRECSVIYPPVELQTGSISQKHDNFYLSVGRLTHTKRIELLIEACNRLERRLVIVGGGRHAAGLKKIAGPAIEFTGRVSHQELDLRYRSCRALLFASDEDFGLVPVEAQGYGRPVVAFGHGGSLETIIGLGQTDETGKPLSPTGVFFDSQTVDSVCDAILRFEANEGAFDPHAIRCWAERFSEQRFEQQFLQLVEKVALDASITLDIFQDTQDADSLVSCLF